MTKEIPHYEISTEVISKMDLLMKTEYSKIDKIRDEIMDKWMRKCLKENGIDPDQSIEIINMRMQEQRITISQEYDTMMNMPIIRFNGPKSDALAFDFRIMNDNLVLLTNFNPKDDDKQ